MKKADFVTLVIGVVATLLFGIGMCMCLLPEWNAFTEGVVVTAIGGIILLAMGIKMLGGKMKGAKVNWKNIGKVAFGVIASLVLGLGMCFILVWNMMLPGILVGIVGIVMLLCLIPMCVGFKD